MTCISVERGKRLQYVIIITRKCGQMEKNDCRLRSDWKKKKKRFICPIQNFFFFHNTLYRYENNITYTYTEYGYDNSSSTGPGNVWYTCAKRYGCRPQSGNVRLTVTIALFGMLLFRTFAREPDDLRPGDTSVIIR